MRHGPLYKILTIFIYGWVGLQVAINLLSVFFVSDGASTAGLAIPGFALWQTLQPQFLMVHFGYLVGNLLFALPAVGAQLWRQKLHHRTA